MTIGRVFGTGIVMAGLAVWTGVLLVPRVAAQSAATTQPADARAPADELAEPPLELVLAIDGRKYEAQLGQNVQVRVGDRDVAARVTAKATRTFHAGGVTFAYPSAFMFESEREGLLTTWTLSGNDVTIMVFKPAVRIDLANMTDAFLMSAASTAPGSKPPLTDVTILLDGERLDGRQVVVELGAARIQQESYAIRHGETGCVLVLQQSLTEGDEASAEMRTVRELLERTFRVVP